MADHWPHGCQALLLWRMPGAVKVAMKCMHGLEFFVTIGAKISRNFMSAALQMSQNVFLLIACLAAMEAPPNPSIGIINVVLTLLIPHLVVFCCFSNSHCPLLPSAALPCAHATMHIVAPVNRFNVRNEPSFGVTCFAANNASMHGNCNAPHSCITPFARKKSTHLTHHSFNLPPRGGDGIGTTAR
jgi:hypothetical protein